MGSIFSRNRKAYKFEEVDDNNDTLPIFYLITNETLKANLVLLLLFEVALRSNLHVISGVICLMSVENAEKLHPLS